MRTKVLALVLGVSGMGLYSQFTNLVSLLSFVVPLGLPLSLTKHVSENSENSITELKPALQTSILSIIVSSVFFSAALAVFAAPVAEFLTDDPGDFTFVVLIAVFLPFSLVAAVLESFIRGLRDITLLSKLMTVSQLVSLIVTITMVYYWGMAGAVISISGSSLIILIIYYYALRNKTFLSDFKFLAKPNMKMLKKLIKLGVASLVIGAINQLSFLFVRKIVIDQIGLDAGGLYQSVLMISLNYFSLLFVLISNYTFPKLNSLKSDTEFVGEVLSTLRIFLLILTPLVMCVVVLREPVVRIFYSGDFMGATEMYKFQFLGDFFRVLAWVTGIWIVSRNRITLWIALELVMFTLFPVLLLILISFMGNEVMWASLAYMIANIVHFSLNVSFFRREFGNFPASREVKILFASLVTLVSVILFSEYSILAGYILLVPVLAVWVYTTTSAGERSSVIKLIKSKISDSGKAKPS